MTTDHQRIAFAKKHGYRYLGKGEFIYEGHVIINEHFISVKKLSIEELNVALSPVKYNGSFVDTIPQ